MNEIKHTPGPWEWVGNDLESNFPGHYESVIEATVDCGNFCYGGSVNLKISDADARLIAAAPDMAMALELIAVDADAGNCRLTSGVRMALDAALIKAGRKEAPKAVRHITVAGVDR
ncbi:hypothetical protein SB394_02670 [Burkholderia sp. BCCIQ04A]|uniref:Uncharacterized protein n=1 Tax=Burkholderia anthinoferrum TaxID=3090833 RepID=A0ABU5WUV7_9BURK|nr:MULTISPECIES: hypothetical protein [Burkholderia]MEB2535869.1 hypothetical protein [Burkholderia anthinoferrum]MEB2561997.1 hypothetical protein [Burkholderia anthinoferrum]MEB2582298.1 hypothetical protein [Burkholderia anthinoferrum]MEB2632623.1 hypothetical protein [Burkholderia anthinoferrum]